MQKTLSVRLDNGIKEQADKFFADMGINTATAVRMFIYTSVNGKSFSFNKSVKRPNAKLLRAINDANNNRNLSPRFKTAKEAIASM
jgi:addiction module RelB/DinJ family antitoxin